MNGLTEAQVARYRAALESKEREIEALLEHSEESSRPPDLDDPVGRLSRMDALQQRAMAAANREAHRARLNLVREAQEAIRDGSFGLCIGCDRPMDPARLDAAPEATHCIACSERLGG